MSTDTPLGISDHLDEITKAMKVCVSELEKITLMEQARVGEFAGLAEAPEPEPPEAPLGVEDVLDFNGKRLIVVAIHGTMASIITAEKFVCGHRVDFCLKARVELAAVRRGDVVRDVEFGLCRVLACHENGSYAIASTWDGVQHYGRLRHHIALAAQILLDMS